MSIPIPDLKARIEGCWRGKAIGGTLGGPHEGKTGPLSLEFYDPVPTSIMPNDDLDLQIVWLHHLLKTGARCVTPALLSEAWRKHVEFPFDEYGICLRNAAYGLDDERLGSFDNWFSECMGAAIRSELWACLAPGDPERAAGFAWCDAVCDHAGDGVWAEVFLATLQSAAFLHRDRDRLLDLALDFLPRESRVKAAVNDARRWWTRSGDWLKVRNELDAAYGCDNFTDVALNLGYTVLGWLAGEGDFGRSLLLANNCGADTDCTAASLGALFGILRPDEIPPRWSEPVGDGIVLSSQIIGFRPPASIAALTDQVIELSEQLRDFRPEVGAIAPREPAALETSPIRVPVEIAWMDDGGVLNSPTPPGPQEGKGSVLPGHWIRRDAADFPKAVMVLKFAFHLEREASLRACAWSQTETTMSIDGRKLTPAGSAGPVAGDSRMGGPSFHRGGRGHADTVGALAAGDHELVIAWSRPAEKKEADLVVGLADSKTNQWLPWALARPAA